MRALLSHGRALCLAVACVTSGGCSHLYDAENHELAKRTQQSFEAAGVSETAAEERKLHEELTQREIAAVIDHRLAIRDRSLARITIQESYTIDQWIAEIRQRHGQLAAGSVRPAHDKVLEAYSAAEGLKSALSVMAFRARMEGLDKSPDCSSNGLSPALSAQQTAVLAPLFKFLKEACDRADSTRSAAERSSAALGGEIGRLSQDLAALRGALRTISQGVKEDRERYVEAKRNYEDAAKGQSPSEPIKKEAASLREALASLENILSKYPEVERVAESFGLDLGAGGAIEAIEAQRHNLDAILATYLEQTPSDETQDGETAKRLYPALLLTSHLARRLESIKSPNFLSALLIRFEELRIAHEAALRRRARTQEAIRLHHVTQMALFEAGISLEKALDLLERLPASVRALGVPQVLAPKGRISGGHKRDVANALIHYSQALSGGAVVARVSEYKLRALQHESILDESELAFQRWSALVSIPLSRLTALHAAGIRRDDIAGWIQILVGAAIAGGVYR